MNYGSTTNEDFFTKYGGDYQKIIDAKKSKNTIFRTDNTIESDATRVEKEQFMGQLLKLGTGVYRVEYGKIIK